MIWELHWGDHGSPGRQPLASDSVRTQRQGTRRCQDAAAGHQTLSGCSSWAPDAFRMQRQGTRHCQDAAAGHQTLSGCSGMAPDAVSMQRHGTRRCQHAAAWHQTLSACSGMAPDAVSMQRQGTRRCQHAAAGHQTLSGRTERRGLFPSAIRIPGGNQGKSGRNVESTWPPDSQLTFCESGALGLQDAQDAS